MTELDMRVRALETRSDLDIVRTASEKYPWRVSFRDRAGEYRTVTGDAAFVLGSLKFDRIIPDHA